MKEKLREKVVAALVAAGYEKAVMEDWEYDGDLALNAEIYLGDEVGKTGHVGDPDRWNGYGYDDFGVDLAVVAILDKFKCYGEWYNAAVLKVVEN